VCYPWADVVVVGSFQSVAQNLSGTIKGKTTMNTSLFSWGFGGWQREMLILHDGRRQVEKKKKFLFLFLQLKKKGVQDRYIFPATSRIRHTFL
jgi:hypothetical protein